MNNLSIKKVLWIDDDPSMLEFGRFVLEAAGHQILTAANGPDGLTLAHRELPHLILLDYFLKEGMNGRDVLTEIMSEGNLGPLYHTPVIMLTGRELSWEERRSMRELGLTAFLKKPFGDREILSVIDDVLEKSELQNKNRLLERELQDAFTSIVHSFVSLLTAKDNYTGEHSGVVLRLAEMVARKCGLDEDLVFDVKIAALLHDIGKIGISEDILNKPGRLTHEEKATMDLHVKYGYQALANIPKLSRVREMVYHHHEWWNGAGYPQKLAGTQIDIGGRIVAVVDAWDAMTSDRPYRNGMRPLTALDRLHAASGTQFDPWVINQFTRVVEDGIPGIERTGNLTSIMRAFTTGSGAV